MIHTKIFSINLYNKYSINITKNVTIASVSLAVYLSSFYNTENNIKTVSGVIEEFVRKGYFGGCVRVFEKKIENGYYYDINSIYPTLILKPLPVGNPVFCSKVDLSFEETHPEYFFGFVRADVTAPNVKILKNTVLPYKLDNGILDYPRGNFSGVWFSEELRNAMKLGYKIEPLYGFSFQKQDNVFKDYINHFYDIKRNTKDPVERFLSKLILNSLYGKWAFFEKNITTVWVDKHEAEKLDKEYNVNKIIKLNNNLFYVKYSVNNHSILSSSNISTYVNGNAKEFVINKKNTPTAVNISAAITSYARIEISKYFNLIDNTCIYTDTDSVVLQNKLPDEIIGKDLGQIKLEHEVKEGMFERNKLYYILTSEGKEIIKSSGVDSKTLKAKDFRDILQGKDVIINNIRFFRSKANLKISIKNQSIKLSAKNSKI